MRGVEKREEKEEESEEQNKKNSLPFSSFISKHHQRKQQQYQRAYRSICPSEWLEKWAEQREAGEFFWFLFFRVFSIRKLGGFLRFQHFSYLTLRSFPFRLHNKKLPNRFLRRQVLRTAWSRGSDLSLFFATRRGKVRAKERGEKREEFLCPRLVRR